MQKKEIKMRDEIKLSICLLLMSAGIFAQTACDTTLFRIRMSSDSSSLFYCVHGAGIRRTIAGPVLMDGERLLFYSINGFVLYEQNGTIADSMSVFSKNGGASPGPAGRLELVQPVDPVSILFCKRGAGGKPEELYLRRMLKPKMKLIKDEEYVKYSGMADAQIVNIAHNGITDEMAARTFAAPNLVGFESGRKAQQWWTLDRLFSFSSPVIQDAGGEYGSFFSGIKTGSDAQAESKRSMIDPVATFVRYERQCYAGVYAAMGTKDDRYNQILFMCDDAGNILHADTILKQSNTDVVLGESVEEKLYYTVRQTRQFVFQPAFSETGDIYYGILDYEKAEIEVRKRTYIVYKPKPSPPDMAHLFDVERSVTYEPVSVSCQNAAQTGRTIPKVKIADEKGITRSASAADLSKQGFTVRIFRQEYRDVGRKLASRRQNLPSGADAIRDTLSRYETSGCPYAISLSGPGALLKSFDYGPMDKVLCARVIAVTSGKKVFIRVDLETYAEILMFSLSGRFVNRFIFNRSDWQRRSDLVAVSNDGRIMEIDYESGGNKGTYFSWTPQEKNPVN
jgi:hypothetical protein